MITTTAAAAAITSASAAATISGFGKKLMKGLKPKLDCHKRKKNTAHSSLRRL